MKIAVSSQNFRTVTPHAGRARRFLVYEVDDAGTPIEVDRLDLPKDMSMHDFRGTGPHPLDGMDGLIVGSCGEGFIERMAARGIVCVTTSVSDPIEAIRDFLARGGTPGAMFKGRGQGHGCGHHGHGHAHGHGHGHSHAHAHGCHDHDGHHGDHHGGLHGGHHRHGGGCHGHERYMEGEQQ